MRQTLCSANYTSTNDWCFDIVATAHILCNKEQMSNFTHPTMSKFSGRDCFRVMAGGYKNMSSSPLWKTKIFAVVFAGLYVPDVKYDFSSLLEKKLSIMNFIVSA